VRVARPTRQLRDGRLGRLAIARFQSVSVKVLPEVLATLPLIGR